MTPTPFAAIVTDTLTGLTLAGVLPYALAGVLMGLGGKLIIMLRKSGR